MSYKTILVYLNSAARAEAVLGAALRIAGRSEAHVIGLHVIPQVTVPAVVPFEVTGEIMDVQRKALEDQAAKIAETLVQLRGAQQNPCDQKSP